MWNEEIPAAFMSIMTNWVVDVKTSVDRLVSTHVHLEKENYETVYVRAIQPIIDWNESMRRHTVATRLEAVNPSVKLMYEYCVLRFIRDTGSSVLTANIQPFDLFAHKVLVQYLQTNDILSTIRNVLIHVTAIQKIEHTKVPLLLGLAEELESGIAR
jgi:hypothetical protein